MNQSVRPIHMPGKPIIGLTGAIGSGKTTVASEFGSLGCLVIDSDRLGHEALSRPEVLQELQSWWGPEVTKPAGGPDRQRIGRIVFDRPDQRKRLESLVFPLIAKSRQDIIQRGIRDLAVKAIILDSPLLFESNLDGTCHATVFVQADEKQRLERLSGRGWDAAEIGRREQWQLPPSEKQRRSDYVITNVGSIESLRAQVQRILNQIIANQQVEG